MQAISWLPHFIKGLNRMTSFLFALLAFCLAESSQMLTQIKASQGYIPAVLMLMLSETHFQIPLAACSVRPRHPHTRIVQVVEAQRSPYDLCVLNALERTQQTLWQQQLETNKLDLCGPATLCQGSVWRRPT